jgi:glucosamine--fructose-6-phosphate aminotransferase (isomerizing)
MCNLAGYVGEERAAPRLLALMRRQEGWAGGYYTGLVTLHEGKLHLRKVVGDLATLCRETDAADLPGTIGIIHSRSKSGGDREWGHPFADPEERVAYVANGALGRFAGETRVDEHVARLRAAGYAFRSRVDGPVGSYPQLADGSCVHFSEIACDMISLALAEGNGATQAMADVLSAFPAEVVGLALAADHPDRILGYRCNMPLMVGCRGTETFLASTAMAFPDPTPEWLMAMPANCAFRVSRCGVSVRPFAAAPFPVGDWQPLWSTGRERVLDELAKGPRGLGALGRVVASLWPESVIPQKDFLVYELIRSLQAEGAVEVRRQTVAGVQAGTACPFREAVLR